MVHRVALVHGSLGVEMQHHRLGSDAEAAGEDVVPLHGGLQVHQPLLGLVVGAVQCVDVLDATHPHPGAAVERLHVQRHADVARHLGEIEPAQVPLRGDGESRIVRRLLVGHHPRLGNAQPQPDHGAVRGVLLHGLERERVVEQVDVVHERHLLQPLARQVVPPGEPVDDEPEAGGGSEVEGLVPDPLRRELVRLAPMADRPDAAEEGRERRRPILFGCEQQPDLVPRCHPAGGGVYGLACGGSELEG